MLHYSLDILWAGRTQVSELGILKVLYIFFPFKRKIRIPFGNVIPDDDIAQGYQLNNS